MNKAVIIVCLLLTPTILQADKYEDSRSMLREILVALSQVSVQGKDANTFSQVQQGLGRLAKDLTDLQSEYKATQEEVMACRAKESPTPEATAAPEAPAN